MVNTMAVLKPEDGAFVATFSRLLGLGLVYQHDEIDAGFTSESNDEQDSSTHHQEPIRTHRWVLLIPSYRDGKDPTHASRRNHRDDPPESDTQNRFENWRTAHRGSNAAECRKHDQCCDSDNGHNPVLG